MEMGRLFDGKIAVAGPLEDFVHEMGGAAPHGVKVDATADESADLDQLERAKCGKASRCGQSGDRACGELGLELRVFRNRQTADALCVAGRECALDFLRSAG